MKTLITAYLLLTFCFLATADIPREDVIRFTYEGDTYYTHAYTEGFTFSRDSVIDYQGTYLGSFGDFISIYYRKTSIEAYPDLIRIPRSKVGQQIYKEEEEEEEEEEEDYYNKDILVLTGDKITIQAEKVPTLSVDSVIIGYAAGEITSPTLSKMDETWINDYPLEEIAILNDGELCQMQLFAIIGNVPPTEAAVIKKELLTYYKSLHLQDNGKVPAKTANDIFAELLKRNILMIGFCSC